MHLTQKVNVRSAFPLTCTLVLFEQTTVEHFSLVSLLSEDELGEGDQGEEREMCVCVRERERDSVCVCVCVREREREREK